ncbi:MAG: sulfate ABC transporter substrate-binding protein [Thermoguttaceae bacterium]
MQIRFILVLFIALLSTILGGCKKTELSREITNVSYDPTRELYKEYNKLFTDHWKKLKNETVRVSQSHGGSGAQSKSVINGQRADVVTLALSYDIDMIQEKTKKLPSDWQTRLPNNSCPYTSTIVFLVRKGNPKQIKDWEDLAKEGVEVVTPNPKTSGGARWNYLAAWGSILKKELGNLDFIKSPEKESQVKEAQAKAREFTKKLFKNVKTMDSGARGSTVRFVQQKSGDVLIAWENEALYFQKMESEQGFEIVVPSVTILAEPPVALMDQNADQQKTRDIAEEYLTHLYCEEAQNIIAQNFYRPSDPKVMEKYASLFPQIETFTIADVFGSWTAVQREHFNADAIFDQIILENTK